MSAPPPGYDDESVVPGKRLKRLIDDLENEMHKVQAVFNQHLPGQFNIPYDPGKEFYSLRASAEEIGSEYSFIVEKLISDYERFSTQPNQEQLDQVFSDIKSLQLLLVG